MRSFFLADMIGLAFVLLFAITRADDCHVGPMIPATAVGGPGGKAPGFCHTQWTNGLVVTGIEVWSQDYHITGIQLTYSDGSLSPLQGQNRDFQYHNTLSWGSQDQITVFRTGRNYERDALAILYMEVAGKKLDMTMHVDVGWNYAGDDVNFGTGYMLGAFGEAGDFINQWAPIFMAQSSAGSITDMVFDESLDKINEEQK